MPTYDYKCSNCGKQFTDIRGIKDYDNDPNSICPGCSHKCGSDCRDFSLSKFTFTGTSVQSPEYNPGLGAVIKNKYHKSEIMKKKGVHEVGNDFGSGDKMQDHFETRKKEEINKAWEKL